MTDPVSVAVAVGEILEALHLSYVLGGSLASSLDGEPRSTLDVDIVVAVEPADITRLTDALRGAFEVDEQAIARAVRDRASVNIFHLESAIKVDLFIAGGTPLDRVQLERRRRVELGLPPARHLFVYTPEDIVLQKLRWFRRGGEVSDRQWRDVLGVLAVCAGRLDIGYMRAQASVIAVEDLLEQALSQVRGA